LKNHVAFEFWNRLVGHRSNVSLEGRIFHSVCIVILVVLGVNIPFNYLIGLPQLAILMVVISFVVAFVYYNSRIKDRLHTSITIFLITNNLLLIANYYYNSGVNGPGYVVFILSFFTTVAIIPQKQYKIWLPLNVGIILSLLFIENAHPDLIRITYDSRTSRFIDFGYSYIATVSLILVVTVHIRTAYNKERKAVEQKAKVLELTNNTKNKLLSILAHDLKEPLSSLQGFLELLTEYQLDEAERVNIEKELLRRTQDTSYMLTNVLSWTKSQMESVHVKLIPLNLLQTLDNTLRILKSIAKEKSIELHDDLTSNIWVIGDRDMLQLVIRNLVINAIKFTYPGGKVTISSEIVENNCIIKVADTGQGIPLAQQASLFSLSAQSTFGTGKEKGAGLGLVLCQEFAALQGGKIWFTSEQNVGSTFFVSLAFCSLTKEQELSRLSS
jgi:two-component system sensor histidine kinase/response regulator